MSAEAVGERSRWRLLCKTPMRDIVHGRLTGRLDTEAMLAEAGLAEPLPQLVRDVVRRTRLWRLEKATVAEELIGHFQDGVRRGRSATDLAAEFGDAVQAARLIGRAKRRNRPLAWRAAVRSMQATGGVIGLVFLWYGLATLRFFVGTPSPTTDYLQQLNAAALATPEEDRAWPGYRAGILSMTPAPKLHYDRVPRPGEPGWEIVEAYLDGNRAALDRIRDASRRPALGYEIGFGIAEEDRALWSDMAANTALASRRPVFNVLLPYLVELRELSQLLMHDARRAAARSEAATALADLEAIVLMSEQILAGGFMIEDLSALAILALGLDGALELLHNHPDLFSNEQLVQLAHRLSAYEDGGSVRISLAGERIGFADMLQHMYTDNGRGDGHLTWEGMKLIFRMGKAEVAGESLDPMILAAGPVIGSLGASRAELLDKHDELMAMAEAHARLPLWERGRSPIDIELVRINRSVTGTVRYLPMALLMSAMGKGSANAELAMQRRDAVLVVIALQLFRRRNGAWPADLEALVPNLLPEVPRDRYDGGRIKYLLRDGEPVLYVTGTDRDDDGGRRPPEPFHKGPIVWLPPEELEEALKGPHRASPFEGDWVLWPSVPTEPPTELDADQAWPIFNAPRR